MSPIVWKEIQKVIAQVREETREETRREDKLEFAEKALAANIKPDTVRLITGLSDEEIQDLLAQVNK